MDPKKAVCSVHKNNLVPQKSSLVCPEKRFDQSRKTVWSVLESNTVLENNNKVMDKLQLCGIVLLHLMLQGPLPSMG